MEALSNSWIPGITGRNLPVPSVPIYNVKTSSSRRNGVFQPTRPSAFAIGKNTQLSMKMSIFLVGEAPVCKFLPRIGRDRNLGISSSKRRLCRTSTRLLFALNTSQGDPQARQDNSTELESASSFSQIGQFCSGPHGSEFKEKRSLLKSTPSVDGGYEREIIFSGLKAVEAAATAHKNHLVPMISDPDDEPLTLAGSVDTLGNSLAVEDEKWLLRLTEGPLRETGNKQQLQREHTHNQEKETRRSVLKHCLPPILNSLGFQFPPKIFSHDRQNLQRASRLNITVSYQMNYVLERTDYGLDVAGESDMNMLHQNGILDSHLTSYYPRKVFARSMDYRTTSRETTSVKMGRMTREKVDQMGLRRRTSHSGDFWSGRVLDPDYHFYAGSGGTLRAGSRVPVPAQNGTDRRLWSSADSGMETAGNLFKDLLTIVGLVAFVVSGTYVFAMSQQYLKSGLWFRKNPFESVMVARSAQEIHPKPNLNQTKVAEMTDQSFVDMIQKRPTFVLFYANWCPYCQKLDPTWNELGNILSNKGYDIQLARMNAEMHPIAAQNFKVVKYPTLIFFKEGIAVDNYLGPRTIHSLMKFIDESLRKKS